MSGTMAVVGLDGSQGFQRGPNSSTGENGRWPTHQELLRQLIDSIQVPPMVRVAETPDTTSDESPDSGYAVRCQLRVMANERARRISADRDSLRNGAGKSVLFAAVHDAEGEVLYAISPFGLLPVSEECGLELLSSDSPLGMALCDAFARNHTGQVGFSPPEGFRTVQVLTFIRPD